MKILLCSYFKFPNGCAGSVRHEKFAQMLKSLEHDVLVVGTGRCNDFRIETFKNIQYTSLRYATPGLKGKIKTRLEYWKNLKKVIQQYTPDCIIMDDLRPLVTIKIKRFAKSKDILLIHDSVEWYSRQQYKLNFLAPALICKNIINRYLIDDRCRVIAISTYLMRHFEAKRVQCVNIPIVVDDEDIVKDKSLEEVINFAYAGQAGKKDYLHVMLAAMMLLTAEEREKFKFHILGCSEQQMIDNGIPAQVIQELRPSLVIYGRVPRDEVFRVLQKSNFTLLIRSEELRYAKAGFPTKVVESLARSTPVIANITSDLGEYLIDGYNSFIVPGCSAEDLAPVLKKAVSLSMAQREKMCQNAYDTALNRFHYKHFLDRLQTILSR